MVASNYELMLLRHAVNAGTFAKELLGWTPDEKQMRILESPARRVLMNCSRQWGKTTLAATKMVHMALTRPGSTLLMISENLAQTSELLAKVDEFLTRLGVSYRGEPGKKVGRRLENGSRIIGLAARDAAVRGYTANFIFIDEAARIPDAVIDGFDPTGAVRRADWWMASTPKGKRGRFWELWEYGEEGPDLLKVSATVEENPRIDPKYLARVRKEKGEDYMRQEFGCQFVETGVELLSLDSVDGLVIRR